VTGGPDLSLVEVSDASTIVQEAAHEDANIIFGAVVDPTLTGKVKITVIATGFGPESSRTAVPGTVQTPVDLVPYTEHMRSRPSVAAMSAASADSMTVPRLSITRLPLLDLPASAMGLALPAASSSLQASSSQLSDPNADFDLSALDVPAFLRRQEG